jgi:hypothetical protein
MMKRRILLTAAVALIALPFTASAQPVNKYRVATIPPSLLLRADQVIE